MTPDTAPHTAPHTAPDTEPCLLAALPWYDLPCWRSAQDALWAALRRDLRDAGIEGLPGGLDRTTSPAAQWRQPRLLLSQCCGPDLSTSDGARLVPIARPVFADVEGPAGTYHSHVVAPATAAAPSGRIAVNARSSRSGCLSLLEWLDAEGRSRPELVITGSHAASLDLLRAGGADLAAIDAHSWHGLDTRDVRCIGRTAPSPTPPWVMHAGCEVFPGLIRAALSAALATHGAALGIEGLLPADHGSYAPGAT